MIFIFSICKSKGRAQSSKTKQINCVLTVLGGLRILNSWNEWVFEWLLLWQACCDRITHSVEQIGPWVPAGPRGLSIAPRLRLSQRWAAHSKAVPRKKNTLWHCKTAYMDASILLSVRTEIQTCAMLESIYNKVDRSRNNTSKKIVIMQDNKFTLI